MLQYLTNVSRLATLPCYRSLVHDSPAFWLILLCILPLDGTWHPTFQSDGEVAALGTAPQISAQTDSVESQVANVSL